MDDPYKVLGVPSDATPDDIRKAYRGLAKQHHPDLNPGNEAAENRFKAISAANEILSDPIKRGQFDRGEINAAGQERAAQPSYRDYAEGEQGRRYARSRPRSDEWNTHDLGDIFNSIFTRDQGGEQWGDHWPHAASAALGRDEHYSLTTAFLDAVNGTTQRFKLPDGRTLDVKIPVGTLDGQILRLRGQGAKGTEGDGDALITITVAPHSFFQRDGQDVRLELPVTLSEATLGGPVRVPTLGGAVRMQIPPGSDSGTELRLRGRGVPAHGNHSVGDLYARLKVQLGPPDGALEAFLRTWKPDHPFEPRLAMGESL